MFNKCFSTQTLGRFIYELVQQIDRFYINYRTNAYAILLRDIIEILGTHIVYIRSDTNNKTDFIPVD